MHGLIAGWHLIYDAQVKSEYRNILGDTKFLDKMFRDLVELVDMEILVPPTFKVVELDPAKLETAHDEGGVTGTCLITTSHLSIHTWPLRGVFSFDLYSCKNFNQDAVDKFLQDRLHVQQRASHWIVRNWP